MRLSPLSPICRTFWIAGLIILGLSACTSIDRPDDNFETQKYFFLESLKRVEGAGLKLQASDLSSTGLQQALSEMDEGLKLAFQVETQFLNQLDPRLGKNYQRYFVKGVETYRLGVEAGIRSEQQQGMLLLGQWTAFWDNAQALVDQHLFPN